jgi:hypothetical protein
MKARERALRTALNKVSMTGILPFSLLRGKGQARCPQSMPERPELRYVLLETARERIAPLAQISMAHRARVMAV